MEYLIRNKDLIKSEQEYHPNLESDDYNNLLVLEGKIEYLHEYGILSDMDIVILNSVSDDTLLVGLKTIIKDRHTLSNSFKQICNRIGFFLGGYFTDEGFLENMKINYKLSDLDLIKLKKHMKSKFRNKLKRKIIND